MGKSYTPKYRVEYRDNTETTYPRFNSYPQHAHLMGWPKSLGKPSNDKAEKLRQDMNTSFNHGGTNYHVSQSTGVIIHIHTLNVIEQNTGMVIAEANMPAFEVA